MLSNTNPQIIRRELRKDNQSYSVISFKLGRKDWIMNTTNGTYLSFATQIILKGSWIDDFPKRFKIPKGQSEAVNRRRTNNTMAKRTNNTMVKRTNITMAKRTNNAMTKRQTGQTKNALQNPTQKTNGRATWSPVKTSGKLLSNDLVSSNPLSRQSEVLSKSAI